MNNIANVVVSSKLVRSDKFLDLYANGIGFRVSPNDLGLVFLRSIVDENGESKNEEQVAITMSPQVFKTVVITALAVLNKYEESVGEVKLLKEPDTSVVGAAFAKLNK